MYSFHVGPASKHSVIQRLGIYISSASSSEDVRLRYRTRVLDAYKRCYKIGEKNLQLAACGEAVFYYYIVVIKFLKKLGT
jgi:hypothetical protein